VSCFNAFRKSGSTRSAVASRRLRHDPLIALPLDDAGKLRRHELRDHAAIHAQKARHLGQRGVAVGFGERVAPGERPVPRGDDRRAPRVVEIGCGRLKDDVPGLIEWLPKHRIAEARPLLAEARGDAAGVNATIAEIGGPALQDGLRRRATTRPGRGSA
jgi:hypothetical protein